MAATAVGCDGPAKRRAEHFMARWGVLAVPLSFLTVGVQSAVNATAGLTRVPLVRYLPAVSVGALLWAVVYATVGLAAIYAAAALALRSPWAAALLAMAAAGAGVGAAPPLWDGGRAVRRSAVSAGLVAPVLRSPRRRAGRRGWRRAPAPRRG